MISNVPIASISTRHFDAIVFDLDGVVTQTATVHAAAWKHAFDELLATLQRQKGSDVRTFDQVNDYLRYIDGKPRYDGARDFLAARGIALPHGDPADRPGLDSICALANYKNELFLKHLGESAIEVFVSTVALIIEARERGLKTAIISSSRNAGAVLRAAGVEELFDAKVDGNDLQPRQLAGKPRPDMFLAAASDIGSEPARTVVVEDAIAGVEAGRAGNFGMVIGVDRADQRDALLQHGADVVVSDLEEVVIAAPGEDEQPPSALEEFESIAERLSGRALALFLDYDGTLTPIVDRPEAAHMSGDMRDMVESLSRHCTVAIVSGRDRADLQRRVKLDDVYYIGSHGYDIAGPEGVEPDEPIGTAFVPALDSAERAVQTAVRRIRGVQVERKRYSLAVHYRRVAEQDVPAVVAAVNAVLANHPTLKKGRGKKVLELNPNMDWHKGAAVLWLLESMGLTDDRAVAMYIGDDVTDENAFESLAGLGEGGITILVADEPRNTAAGYMLRDTEAVAAFLRRLDAVLAENVQ